MTRHAVELAPPPRGAARPAASRFGWADLIGPVAVGTVVFATCLWLRDEGLASLTTFDSALGSLGSLTGLLASDLMLLQVLMLARIPWVERAWGHDLLARRHKWVGYASFWLVIIHVLMFVAQRLTRAGGWDGATIYQLFVQEPWLLAATVGTGLLILVVVTSIRAARRRLRYESWHLLHLYAYLGLALALPHQIADGEDFHSTFNQVYWWTLYAVAAAAIVICRLGLPIWRSVHHRVRVVDVTRESDDAVSVTMEGRQLGRLRTKSGQFFIWRFLDGPGWSRGNPYTISAAPGDNRLRVTVQAAGDGSGRAARLRPGTRVFIEGPYGSMTSDRRRHSRVLLMAAGVGITPIRALLEDLPYAPGEATLVYRYSRAHDAILTREIDAIAAHRGVDVRYLPGPRRADGSWLPTGSDGVRDDVEGLELIVPDVPDRDIFVCGPPAWITAVRRAARAAGATREQIHTEDFAW
jgi:predicted ferric reductase